MSVEKMPMFRVPEIGDDLGRVLQRRETKERRLGPAQCGVHGAGAFLKFFLGLVDRQFRQIGMRPGMRADGVPCRGHLLEDFGMPHGVLADGEEQGLGALRRERLEDCGGVAGPRAVVEGQHHLVLAQKIVGFEVLEAEAGPAGGIDLHDTRDAERIRVLAGRARRGGCIGATGRRECGGVVGDGNAPVGPTALAALPVRQIGREAIVPVTSSGSANSEHAMRQARTVSSRPSVKLIAPTATAMALTAAKTAIPRITRFPPTQKLPSRVGGHHHAKWINIWFGESGVTHWHQVVTADVSSAINRKMSATEFRGIATSAIWKATLKYEIDAAI